MDEMNEQPIDWQKLSPEERQRLSPSEKIRLGLLQHSVLIDGVAADAALTGATPDMSALSPTEKIRLGLAQQPGAIVTPKAQPAAVAPWQQALRDQSAANRGDFMP